MEKYFCCKFNINANETKKKDPQVTRLLVSLHSDLVLSTKPYCEIETNVKNCFEILKNHLTGLRISDEERSMILKAMNLNQGHWFKCKKRSCLLYYGMWRCHARERLSGLWIKNRYKNNLKIKDESSKLTLFSI